MARKTNYKFERMERDRQKAAKKAARLEAKKEKSDLKKAEGDGLVPEGEDLSGAPGETPDQPEDNGEPDR
jgi:hypothetical protein